MKTTKERGFTRVSLENKGMSPAAAVALAKGDHKNFMAASTPGGIEAQEKEGQLAQALLETLPIDMHGCAVKDFEKLGFVFGEKTDRIFWQCKFPAGWKKQPTSHSMWSDLLDDKGRKRGSIFFKAAFYDYSAHIGLTTRYATHGTSLDENYEEIYDLATGSYREGKRDTKSKFTRYDVIDRATNTIIHKGTALPDPDWDNREEALKRSDAKDKAADQAREWLKAKFPSCADASAYWD